MIKKLLFTLCVIACIGNAAMAQSTIKGVVKDPAGSPVPFLQVLLEQEGKLVDGSRTNEKGEYQIFNISAGTYDLVAGGTMTCPNTTRQAGIYVSASEVRFVDMTVNCQSNTIEGEVVVTYKPPIFDIDQTTSSSKMTGDEVRQTPGRSISAALNNLEGVSSSASGESFHRGNRPDGQQMIIDGVRVRGGSVVSMQSVEGAELIQGGIPAEYGDGTSFTVITTRGVAKTYNGSAEIRGSLDGYNNFLAAGAISGPIIKGKTDKDPAIMGFLLTAEATYDKDAAPARGGTWKANDDVINDIATNPYIYNMETLGAFTNAAEYLTEESFYKQRVRDNVESWTYFLQGKIDLLAGAKNKSTGKSLNNIRLSVGGSYQYGKYSGTNWSQSSTLFMPTTGNINQQETINQTIRMNARLSHRVKTNTSDSAILKNLMYDVNVNYTNWTTLSQDAIHKDNFFHYGYVGKFTQTRERVYTWYGDPNFRPEGALQAESWQDGYQVGNDVFRDVLVFTDSPDRNLVYQPGSSLGIEGFTPNTYLETYTNNFYNTFTDEFFRDYYGDNYDALMGNYDRNLYEQFGALLNGEVPGGVYGMYNMPGTAFGGYSKSSNNSIGAKASLSMNLKNHEIKLGFDFEKLTYRSWGVSAFSLWEYMRQRQNWHMQQIDFSNPIYSENPDGSAQIDYNWLVNLADQPQFDRVIREELGMDPNGYDNQWIDIDSYDLTMYDNLGMGMFSQYELMNGLGDPLVSYSGYDYTGTQKYDERDKSSSIKKFFGTVNPETGRMEYDFSIGAYEPIYMALYLQDKFAINSLLFNVGLRVDYFDANQQVLKDPYLFREAYTVNELRNHENEAVQSAFANSLPTDAQANDWVVYLNSKDQTAEQAGDYSIVGYRNGNQWFDASGKEISDPTSILGAQGGPIIKEGLVDGAISKVSGNAFEDYNPWDKISFMPRISFSFPVSDVSLFYAHYNIITYRPTNLSLDPVSYLFIENNPTAIINNPNLKPQKSIDYEIGFRQKIGENSAVSIAAYYSEKRDQIQTFRFTGAYPATYYSYDNIDFGTVQGFTFGYNLRADKYVNLRANYTLQFAKGTGSDATSNAAIIASGQPNLRTLNNLAYDQRHRITANIDIRFGTGTEYDGPESQKEKVAKDGTKTVKTIKWFENAGITFLASAASGMPYSRSSTASSGIAGRGKSSLQGSINGSFMPWIFQCDVRVDKSWTVNLNNKKSSEGKAKSRKGYITAYLDIQNIFNFKNIVFVYDYTGSPEDDGYLSTSEGMTFLDQQVSATSYENYYNMLMRNPYYYSSPTRINLGIQFGF